MALTDNITSYYKFDSDYSDSVGSNTGSGFNTPTFTSGKINNALTLASASSQYATVPNAAAPFGTANFSISYWLKFTSIAAFQGLVMAISGGNGLESGLWSGSIKFVKYNGGSGQTLFYNWTPSTGTYYHIVFTSSSTNGANLYINNSNVATFSSNTQVMASPGTALGIGTYYTSGSPAGSWYLDGQIDELGMWTRELTSTDVSNLYNSGSGLQYPFGASSGAARIPMLSLLGVG